MSEILNLKEIKRQVYLYYSEDGLIDLAIGLVIFGFGALLLADLPAMVGVLGLIPLLIWYLGKRYLTIPRIGSIQPDQGMKTQFVGFSINMIAIGVGVFLLFILTPGTGTELLADHPLALFGFMLALAISALGLLMKTNRMYYYAMLVFLAMAIGEILNKSIITVDLYLLSVIIAGGIIIVSGIIVLVKFLNKYPIVLLEDNHDR
ncbi:MAG: hypothetical protein WBB64_14755 [Anaerolineales bacterium]